MRIGNLHKEVGVQLDLNKWYFGLEFSKCPPTMYGVFRPYIFVALVKITDYGDVYKRGGSPQKWKGFKKHFLSPIGITFEIIKYF